MIEILGDRGCSDQKLAVRGGHDCRKDCGQENTADKYMENVRYHGDIYGFLRTALQKDIAKVHAAGNADEHRGGQGNQHPHGRNTAGFFDCRR